MKYDYSVVSTNGKRLSITISALNKICVRCPIGYSRGKIEKFLNDKSKWIDKILQANAEKLSSNREILAFKRIYINGVQVPLCLNAKRNAILDEGVFVRNLNSINTLYKRSFSDNLNIRVSEIAYLMQLFPTNISVKDYKSRWGCCDCHNALTFNYKLFMLPQRLQDYVIVHELCHIKFHNHSTNFWRLVEKYCPHYKAFRKELKNYDFLTRLY